MNVAQAEEIVSSATDRADNTYEFVKVMAQQVDSMQEFEDLADILHQNPSEFDEARRKFDQIDEESLESIIEDYV